MVPNNTSKSPASHQLTVDIFETQTSTVGSKEFREFMGVICHNNKIKECI